ncbi:MAG: ABC transporter substrate-binding protein [Clostridiales bacterium]|jgi:peptide/nickel transport system substrate-binding protein|nr:ABC transporter substrate-binding protein [Clostridiales bacterium]
MKKQIALVLIAVFMLTAITACGKASAPPASEPDSGGPAAADTSGLSDEIITVAISAEPNQIVPDIAFAHNDVATINSLIYEPLLASEHSTLEPKETALVTVEKIDDTHFRLTLRQGVKFHNGEEFTTADVQYMFEEGKKGGFAGDRYFVFDADNFVIEDDYHIVIALTQPWAQAIDLLGFEQFFVISKTELSAIGGAGKTAQYVENAGTGKYKFKEWVPGEYILLERNEDYWDKDHMGYFAGFKFVFITDTTARGMAVQSGDADIALSVDLANYAVYEADTNVKTVPLPINNVYVLFLNSGAGGPFEDIRVRQAVEALLDKEAIRRVAASGFGEICDTIISPSGPMWDGVTPEVKPVDIEKAKALLAEAGYADGLTVRLRTGAESALTSLIQEQLRLGGITVELVLAENTVHFEGLAQGDFDMYPSSQQFAYYTEAVRTSDGLTYSYRDVMGGCGYKNEAYTEIARRCYTASDLAERKKAYAELQKHYRENTVSVALYSVTGLNICRPDIEGFELRGTGSSNLENIFSTK